MKTISKNKENDCKNKPRKKLQFSKACLCLFHW